MEPTERVDEIMGRWREDAEQGRWVDPQSVLKSHPEHADLLADRFAAQALVDDYFADADGLPLLTPERIGDYRILSELGRGGMGVVYEAIQESMRRKVALKVLYPTIATTVRTRKRFEREARLTGRLHHSNIVTVYAMGQDRAHFYFAMELIEGRPLDEVIGHLRASDKGEPTSQASQALASELRGRGCHKRIALKFAAVADALHLAHSHGVIHRDVKPSNLVLDESGDLKLTDFGLAQLIGEDLGITRTGEALGTPLYMSPEQVRARKDGVDQRTDVYSLGATLYELLALVPIHDGLDVGTLCSQILTNSPCALRLAAPEVPRDLATIVHKALQKQRGDRYASAGEMGADLRAFSEGRPISARPLGVAQRSWRTLKRRPIRSALATLVLLLLAAGLWLRVDADQARARERAASYETTLAEAYDAATIVTVHAFWALRDGQSSRTPLLRAETLFARAMGLNPSAPEPWVGRALLVGRPQEDRLRDLEQAAVRGLRAATVSLAERVIKGDRDDTSITTPRAASGPDASLALDHFLDGWYLVARGERDLGIQALDRALDTLPAQHYLREMGLMLRAQANKLEGHWGAVIQDYAASFELSKHAPFVGVLLAEAWHGMGQPAQAELTFRSALVLAKRGVDESAWKRLTIAAQVSSRPAWRDSAYDAAVAANPRSPWLLAQAAEHYAVGAPERAQILMKQALERLTAQDPDELEVLKSKGRTLVKLGREDEARALMTRLLERHPEDPELLHSVGVLVADRDPAQGARLLKASLATSPDNPMVFAALATLHERMGQYDEAARLVKRGLRCYPLSVVLYAALSRMHILRGEWDKALAVVDRGLLHLPDHPTLLYARAESLNNLQRYEEALAAIDKADKAPHRIPRALSRHYLRGFALEMSGMLEKALAAYRSFGEEESNRGPQPLLAQARVLRGLGRKGDAGKALDLALESNAHSVNLLSLRAREAIEQGRLEEAQRDIAEALRQAPEHRGTLALDRYLKALSGELVARSPEDHLMMAYTVAGTSPKKALEHMTHALQSEKVRADLRQAHLYNAACFAALASDAAADALEKSELASQSMDLLREWRSRWHRLLEASRVRGDKGATAALESRWQGSLSHALRGDPDLVSLRKLPTFKRLFNTSDAAPERSPDKPDK